MIWLNFKILNINWDRCILSLVTWFKLGDRLFPLLLSALASSPGACPSSLLMWPVSVSFLLWTVIFSSCYPLVASLFLFLILGWICKWGLTFPLFFSHWRFRLTWLQLPLLHCSSGQYVLPISVDLVFMHWTWINPLLLTPILNIFQWKSIFEPIALIFDLEICMLNSIFKPNCF